jgi:hypothetical protein
MVLEVLLSSEVIVHTMSVGYLFLCSNLTQKECFERRLFGLSAKFQHIVEKIQQGSFLFLYNINSKRLMGPFSAASNGKMNIVPEAWTNAMPLGYPAQVEVEWRELHEMKEAPRFLTFIKERYHYELSSEETEKVLDALKQAPVFVPPGEIYETVHIDSAAERRFAELLDDKEITYIRFSQTPGDFSRVLKDMKAKRPDFLVFVEKPYFIEVKPWPLRYYKNEIEISLEEIEKLKQLELATGINVFMAFPIDTHGLEWRAIRPGWVWATGMKKTVKEGEILTIPVKELEKRKLPFLWQS